MRAERIIDGIPVNPVLPKHFYAMDNQKRPNSPWCFGALQNRHRSALQNQAS